MADTKGAPAADAGLRRTTTKGTDPNPGPVPYHHRMKLGATDTVHNPYGNGAVSTKPTVANGDRKNW